MKQITTGDVTASASVCLYLKSKRNALLASVFASRELGADAVDTDEDGGVMTGVPYTLQRVHLTRVDLDVQQPVRQRYVYTQFNPLTTTFVILVQLAIEYPVPDRVKPSSVIFDIRALGVGQSALSVIVPGYQRTEATL